MLPELSHLQAFVLSLLRKEELSGIKLRQLIKDRGHKFSKVSFYVLMGRQKRDGLVTSRAVLEEDGVNWHRMYQLTEKGQTALTQVRKFYRDLFKKSR